MPGIPHASPDVFGQRADAWALFQETPWGRMRHRLVAHTVARALDLLGPNCRVLDMGGGDGADSLPLARQGHQVTILDHTGILLDRAVARASAAGVANRVQTVCADLDQMAADCAVLKPDQMVGYDLVLCHNVLQYLTDVPTFIDFLARAARPGGMLSVLAPNPAMDVLSTAIRRMSPPAAMKLLGAATIRSETFQCDMQRLEPSVVEAALSSAGCHVQFRFGIRCVTDLIADEDAKRDPAFFAALERLELELCGREPYRRLARFWQLVAAREPAPASPQRS